MIKGDILYSENKKIEAEAEYQKALQKNSTFPSQKAVALNKLGRLQANEGNYQQARELYDQAVEIDPYYIEAKTNKGATYEKEGDWDKALSIYNQALSMDEDVDRVIKTMKSANIAFNVPKSMKLSETIDIILILDLTKSIEELTQMIQRSKVKGKKRVLS